MAVLDLQKLRDPTGKVAIRPEKSDGTLGEALKYDVTSAEWQLSGDRVLTESDVGSSGGLLEAGDDIDLSINSSTGNTRISVEDIVDFDQVILSTNQIADTSGDLQIRDDSDGDLFSLDDGNSPPVSARYEGNGAFTFGFRDTFPGTGQNSVVLSGGSGNPNQASGDFSVAMGGDTKALGVGSTAMGGFTKARGLTSTAMGNFTTASAENSTAMGGFTTASAKNSTAMGNRTFSRVYGGLTQGSYNEDYLGFGNEVGSISNLSTDSRIFAVGVGDNPSSTSGDGDYFDGRGRVDGLYVTMRNGTHVRHGLSVDGYNASLGKYETVFEVDETGSIVKGSVSVDGSSLDAAGPDGSIQFNENDNFSGSSDFTWDDNAKELTVGGTYRLTDSTGTYDAVDFQNNGTTPYFTSGPLGKTSTKDSYELWIGTDGNGSQPSSSDIGDQNFVVGAGALSFGVSTTDTIQFVHATGNLTLASSSFESPVGGMTLLGNGVGFNATFDNNTSSIEGDEIATLAIGTSALRNAVLDQAGSLLVVGEEAMLNTSGNYSFTTAIGNNVLKRAGSIRDSVFIGDSAGLEISNTDGLFALGNFTATADTSSSGNQYAQQDGISNSIILGNSAFATKDNQLVVGAPSEQAPIKDTQISEAVIGQGPYADNPSSVTITTTDVRTEPASVGVNGDKQGGNMIISSGQGTGSGTPSTIPFKTSTIPTNTYDQQSLVTRMTMNDNGVQVNSGDLEVEENEQGVILSSPDGTRFRVHVENDGTIVSTELP